jgi:hypothetical protein
MKDFIAEPDRALLERHGLASYDALWARTRWQRLGSRRYNKETCR